MSQDKKSESSKAPAPTQPAPSQALQATSSTAPRTNLRQYLEKNAPQRLAELLPKGTSPDRFLRVALLAVTKNPDLLESQPESVLFGLLEAARLGLEIGGARAQAALVVYNNKVKIDGVERWRKQAQFQPMVTGLMDLARRSKQVKKIWSRPVYKGDRFEIRYGSVEEIIHVPAFESEELTHVYACAVVQLNGESEPELIHEVMTKKQIEKIRARSKAKSGPWTTDYDEMARKTVVKRLCKYLPTEDNVALADAVDIDNRTEYDAVGRELLDPAKSPEQNVVSQTAARTEALEARIRPPVQDPAPNALDNVQAADVVVDESEPPPAGDGEPIPAGGPPPQSEEEMRREEQGWINDEQRGLL